MAIVELCVTIMGVSRMAAAKAHTQATLGVREEVMKKCCLIPELKSYRYQPKKMKSFVILYAYIVYI